jgi:hypothetical protein
MSTLDWTYANQIAHWYVDVSPSHETARYGALSMCMATTKPFSEVRAWMNRHYEGLSYQELARLATEFVAIEPVHLRSCVDRLSSGLPDERLHLAQTLGVPGTPTVIVGRRSGSDRVTGWVFLGFVPTDTLRHYIGAATNSPIFPPGNRRSAWMNW